MRTLPFELGLCLAFSVMSLEIHADSRFTRGDVDGVARIGIADAIGILAHLFVPTAAPPLACLDAADVDDDGQINITDVTYLLGYLFRGTTAPPVPFVACRNDPTADSLDCQAHRSCDGELQRNFYTQAADADLVIFVLDRSQFMQGNGELQRAKQDVAHWLVNADFGTRYGIVFSAAEWWRFPDHSAPQILEDGESTLEAVHFLIRITGSQGACLREALLAALDWLDAVAFVRAQIFVVGSGAVDCLPDDPQDYAQLTVDEVTARNAGRATIHTLGELVRTEAGDELLGALAARNGGQYTRF